MPKSASKGYAVPSHPTQNLSPSQSPTIIYFPPYVIPLSLEFIVIAIFFFLLPGEEKLKGQSVEVEGSQQRLFYSPDVLVLCNVEVCVNVGCVRVCVCVCVCACMQLCMRK